MMMDRPSKHEQQRRTSHGLALESERSRAEAAHGLALESERSGAEAARGFGSFELDLATGEARYSPGLRRILAAPDDLRLTTELLRERVHPEDREVVESLFGRGGREHEALS